jgi:hypothetical protein
MKITATEMDVTFIFETTLKTRAVNVHMCRLMKANCMLQLLCSKKNTKSLKGQNAFFIQEKQTHKQTNKKQTNKNRVLCAILYRFFELH